MKITFGDDATDSLLYTLSAFEGYNLKINGRDSILLNVYYDDENNGLLSIDFRDYEALRKSLNETAGAHLPPVMTTVVDDDFEIHVY